MIQALWPLDQSNLERASGGALFDLPTLAQLVDRGSDVFGDSFDPDVPYPGKRTPTPAPLSGPPTPRSTLHKLSPL